MYIRDTQKRIRLLQFPFLKGDDSIHGVKSNGVNWYFPILLLCVLFIGNSSHAQLDTLHYIPPTFGQYGNSNIDKQEIHLSTPISSTITVTITDGAGNAVGSGNNGTPGEYEISNGSPYILTFPDAPAGPVTVSSSQLGKVMDGNGEGLKLVSTEKFFANLRFRGGSQAGSLTAKGRFALGRHFKWAGPPNRTTNGAAGHSILSIMAIDNPTTVNITDYNSSTVFYDGTNASGITDNELEFDLAPGESIIICARANTGSANRTGFLGANITSTEDIVVNTGGTLYAIENTGSRDIGIDQIIPIEYLGTQYIIVQGNGGSKERVIVTGTVDGTEVEVNGSNYGTVNDGDFLEIHGNQFSSNQNMFVKTSKPAYVHHSLRGRNHKATDGLNFIPPVSSFNVDELNELSQPRRIAGASYSNSKLLLTVETGATLLINGSAPSQSPQDVSGNPYWKTYRIPITSNSDYTITATGKIGVSVFGGSGVVGFAGYFSGLDLLNESCSSDLDQVNDVVDLDDDNDGIPDSVEGDDNVDTDNDGRPNYKDIDSDNDGIPDIIEAQATDNFIAPSGVDTDRDGLDDAFDEDCNPCGSIFGVAIVPIDFDQTDGIPDYIDTDSDNDGTLDFTEAWDFDFDGEPDYELTYQDIDCDGYDDFYDSETDRSITDPANGLTPSSFPDSDGVGEPNWRDAMITLPVDLLYFNAVAQGENVMLEWVTASETNNDYFLVERSDDLENWYNVIMTEGQGNSSVLVYYNEIDEDPFAGANYYRLTQFDFDGSNAESDIVTVYVNRKADYVVYPNPASDYLRIKGAGEFSEDPNVNINLFDIRGNRIEIETRFFDDELFITFQDTNLSGNFLLRINEQSFVIQILKY